MTKKDAIIKSFRLTTVVIVVFLQLSCNAQTTAQKDEILIYCGITMIRPVTELARIVEKEKDCRIIVTKGGSGNLLNSILVNKVGDIYMPGSESYYRIIDQEHSGLITYRKKVGDNYPVLMVRKGNPQQVDVNLDALTCSRYAVVIGSPDSGSIGKVTKKILEKKGIYPRVVSNTIFMTTDSKDLVKVLREQQADIVVNWFAASTWDDNSKFIDVYKIDKPYQSSNELIMGVLNTTKNFDIARYFVDFSASEEGARIFRKHGLKIDE